jgi:peptide/nickel transport system substrate-binding protein
MEENEMQRKYILLTCLIIAAVILSACKTSTTATVVPTQAPVVVSPTETTAPAQHTVAKLIWTQEFDTLNPLYTNMWFVTVTEQVWNSWAWEYNDKNEAFPRLVTEIPSQENGGISADYTTITMTLRSDVVWSDGTPLTATDFKFTWQMYIAPKNTVATVEPYDKVTSIDTPDDHTVVMHFSKPYIPWLSTFWHSILPAHILQPVFDTEGTLDNADWNRAPTVGLGPYVFDTWESGSYA